MNVISTHLIKTVLHYEWKRVPVGAVNDLSVLEGISNLLEKVLGLYCCHRVTLDRANKPHAIFFQKFKALLVIVVDYKLHILDTNFDLFHGSMIKQVVHQDVPIGAYHQSFLFSAMP